MKNGDRVYGGGRMNIKELNEVLENHKLWLFNGSEQCANLQGVQLKGVQLENSNISNDFNGCEICRNLGIPAYNYCFNCGKKLRQNNV